MLLLWNSRSKKSGPAGAGCFRNRRKAGKASPGSAGSGRLAADKAYGTGPFLGWLSERRIMPHIPVLDRQHQTDGLLPREAFTYDADQDRYICPQGKILKHRTACEDTRIHTYRATASDC